MLIFWKTTTKMVDTTDQSIINVYAFPQQITATIISLQRINILSSLFTTAVPQVTSDTQKIGKTVAKKYRGWGIGNIAPK